MDKIPDYILDVEIGRQILERRRIYNGQIFEENKSMATIARTLESFSKGNTNYLRYQIIPENTSIRYCAIENSQLLKSLASIIEKTTPEKEFCFYIFDKLFDITTPRLDYSTIPPTQISVSPTDSEKYLLRMNDVLRLYSKWISNLDQNVDFNNLKIINPISYIFPNFIDNLRAILLSVSAIHYAEYEKLPSRRHTDKRYGLSLDEKMGGLLTKGRIYSLIEKIYGWQKGLDELIGDIIVFYGEIYIDPNTGLKKGPYIDPRTGLQEDPGVTEERIRGEIKKLEVIVNRAVVRAKKKWWYVDLGQD